MMAFFLKTEINLDRPTKICLHGTRVSLLQPKFTALPNTAIIGDDMALSLPSRERYMQSVLLSFSIRICCYRMEKKPKATQELNFSAPKKRNTVFANLPSCSFVDVLQQLSISFLPRLAFKESQGAETL